MNNIKHWDKPMPAKLEKKLDAVISSSRRDYLRGYNRAVKKADEWLKTLDECYIGYYVNGTPFIDTKLLRRHFKKIMK